MTNPTDGPHTTTTSPKTNHAEKARELLELPIATTEEQEAALVTAAAQVHATLALEAQTARLADEARTSNLIALWGALRNPPAGIRPTTEQWERIIRLDDLIAARLDLTQDVTP